MEAYPITEQEIKETAFPIFPPLIKLYQQKDGTLRKLMRYAKPGTFMTREVKGEPLIHSEGKIYTGKTSTMHCSLISRIPSTSR